MVSSMTWLSGISNRVGFGPKKNLHPHAHPHHTKKDKEKEKSPPLEILSFEAARTLSRLLCLYKSLSEDQLLALRKEVIASSQGIAYLNSMDESFLLKLACSEQIEDLDRCATCVARFGKKCTDPGLTQFEFAYADLKIGLIDLQKLSIASKEIDKLVDKMDKLIYITSNLYGEMETLSGMEAWERKMKRWKEMNPNEKNTPKQQFSENEISSQRHRVQHLKDASLWNQPFDRVVGFMARTVCVVYARICNVFGPHVSILPMVSSRHVRFSSMQLQFNPEDVQEEEQSVKPKEPFSSKSGSLKHIRSQNFVPQKGNIAFGSARRTVRLLSQQTPPTTVGGAGLSLRYANLITTLEKYLESPTSLTDAGREELYALLPKSIKSGVSSKLKKIYRNQRESECWEDQALADGWRDGLNCIMEWLSPMAWDTVRWFNERSVEKSNFDANPTVLLLQTLHFADKEKTEAAIVEILVGLSFICRYEFSRMDARSSSSS